MANCVRCGRQLPPLTFGKKICQWCVQHERAQRGEEDDDAPQPVITAPWAGRHESVITLTHLLFGANIAVFIAMALANGSIYDFSNQVAIHFGANVGPLTLSGEWWRLVTYMFLHGNLFHIAINMWCLWDLGSLCESLYGRWTYAAIYVLTGVAGGLASLAWNPGTFTVGASGAIFGLAGALIASFYLGEFSVPRIAIQGTLRSLLLFVVISVVFGAMSSGIDNACHAGGLVSGLILGALIARFAPQHDSRRAAVLLFVVVIIAASGLGIYRWRAASLGFTRSWSAQNRNADRTIRDLQKKIQKNPKDLSSRYALAQAFFDNEQYPEAEDELKGILELEPQNIRARTDLATILLDENQSKDAQEQFEKVLAQDPNHAGAHAGLGVALADQGNHAGAIKEYKAALAIEPKARGVYLRMGISQAELKQYDDAIDSYTKEKESGGDGSGLEGRLAEAYAAKGMKQQAQQAQEKADQFAGNKQ